MKLVQNSQDFYLSQAIEFSYLQMTMYHLTFHLKFEPHNLYLFNLLECNLKNQIQQVNFFLNREC